MGSGFCAGHFLTHIGKCILYLAGKKDKIDITEKTVEEVMGSTFLSKIDIEKVRHLRNIEIPLEKTKRKHLILTGKNGSGKTSVLNAIAVEFQKQMVDADVEHKREDGKKADKPMPDWSIKDTEGNSYFVQMMKANQSQRLLKYVKQFNKYVPQAEKLLHGVKLHFAPGGDFAKGFVDGSIIFAYYKVDRDYCVRNSENVEKVVLEDRYFTESQPGKKFVSYLLNLKTTEAMSLVAGKKEKADEIHRWFVWFEQLLQRIFEDDQLKLDFNSDTFEFKILQTSKEPFDFSTLSSGYSAILDIITDIMMRMNNTKKLLYKQEGIVLIDEVETHLHLEMQKNILPILTQTFPNIQFIVTTHSPFVLNSIPDAVIYDLENRTLVAEGMQNLPYDGIVEGYFGAPLLAEELKEKFERYKVLAKTEPLSEKDYRELAELELYLDEIPDYLALNLTTEYRKLRLEMESRS